jgi:hypothetical protein
MHGCGWALISTLIFTFHWISIPRLCPATNNYILLLSIFEYKQSTNILKTGFLKTVQKSTDNMSSVYTNWAGHRPSPCTYNCSGCVYLVGRIFIASHITKDIAGGRALNCPRRGPQRAVDSTHTFSKMTGINYD